MDEVLNLFSKLHPKQAAEVNDLCKALQTISDPYLSIIECFPEVKSDGMNFFSVEKITMRLEKKGVDMTLSQSLLNQISGIMDEDYYWYLSVTDDSIEMILRSRCYNCGFVTVKTHSRHIKECPNDQQQ